jgi:hypothetical protein
MKQPKMLTQAKFARQGWVSQKFAIRNSQSAKTQTGLRFAVFQITETASTRWAAASYVPPLRIPDGGLRPFDALLPVTLPHFSASNYQENPHIQR